MTDVVANPGKKILIVEDDFYIRDLYEMEARRVGYVAVTASDGEEAITKLKSEKPDLVLMDLMLPKRDGISVMKMAKADPLLNKIPCIVITNLEDPAKEQEAREAGATDYLLKIKHTPVDVINKVNEYLSKKMPSVQAG